MTQLLLRFSFLIGILTLLASPPMAARPRQPQHSPNAPQTPPQGVQPPHHVQRRVAEASVYELWYVDREPEFPGGEGELLRYINSQRCYPAGAYAAGVSGRVICSFVISADGSVSHVRVVRGVEESLDREAVRIISSMPRWAPAFIDCEAVSVNYVLPIPFRL